jgi:hypothetical protein
MRNELSHIIISRRWQWKNKRLSSETMRRPKGVLFVVASLLGVSYSVVNAILEETCGSSTETATPEDATCESASCIDDDDAVCELRASQNKCETYSHWMLLHCRKSCAVCLSPEDLSGDDDDVVVAFKGQNAGFGMVPPDISVRILQSVRKSNLYLRDEVMQKEEFDLVRSECVNKQDMCSFWAFQERCSESEYSKFMAIECPLACRSCGSDVRKGRAFLRFLLGDLESAYNDADNSSNSGKDVVANRYNSLTVLMSHIGMTPSLLGRSLTAEDGNWLEDLQRRISALVPPVLFRLYYGPQGPTDKEDIDLLTALHELSGDSDSAMPVDNMFVPYRERGYIVSIMRDFDHLITRPVQLGVGFAIPNNAALEKIKTLGTPVVQVGAGAGYWAALLRIRGIDIVAYDIHPPDNGTENLGDAGTENVFFDVAYVNDIMPGSCADIFAGESGSDLAQTRTLLLIWPNDPDPIDNTHLHLADDDDEESQAVWDSECLSSYMNAGGSKVIYVGEREDNMRLLESSAFPDSGISSTRRFQKMLSDNFSLVETVKIPQWWLNEDDMTIWERK